MTTPSCAFVGTHLCAMTDQPGNICEPFPGWRLKSLESNVVPWSGGGFVKTWGGGGGVPSWSTVDLSSVCLETGLPQ